MRRSIWLAALFALGFGTVAELAAQVTIPFNVIRTVPHTRGYGSGLTFDTNKETVWVADAFGSTIEEYDPYTGTLVKTIIAPNTKVRDLTFDGKDLWMASWFSPPAPSVFRLDANSGSVLQSYVSPFTGGKSNGMAFDGADLWVGEEANQIHKINPANFSTIVATIPVPRMGSFNPRGLAWDTNVNQIWVAYQSSNGLIRKHDAATGNPLEEFRGPYGSFQQGLAWDGHFLWATGGSATKTMSQIDVTAPFVDLIGQLSPNTNIQFQMTQATGQAGNVFLIGWSGTGTRGFRVGSKVIPLTLDNFTLGGLSLAWLFRATIDANGQATTPSFRWPAVPAGTPLWVCGLTLDTVGIVSVTEPFKFLARP